MIFFKGSNICLAFCRLKYWNCINDFYSLLLRTLNALLLYALYLSCIKLHPSRMMLISTININCQHAGTSAIRIVGTRAYILFRYDVLCAWRVARNLLRHISITSSHASLTWRALAPDAQERARVLHGCLARNTTAGHYDVLGRRGALSAVFTRRGTWLDTHSHSEEIA